MTVFLQFIIPESRYIKVSIALLGACYVMPHHMYSNLCCTDDFTQKLTFANASKSTGVIVCVCVCV